MNSNGLSTADKRDTNSLLTSFLSGDIEIIITGDVTILSNQLDIGRSLYDDCINIYVEDNTISVLPHKLKKLLKYMKATSFMRHRKYLIIRLLVKDRLKIQAMMAIGFSFEDVIYELYIKDKEIILKNYS